MKIKIGVVGCLGRMGKEVLNELFKNNEVKITGAVTSKNSKYLGCFVNQVLGYNFNSKIKITSSIKKLFELSDIVIDFTTKKCMLNCLNTAVMFKTPLVSGTTGIKDINLVKYSTKIPLLWSANMSTGINVLLKLVKIAAKLLDNEYDAEIWEMHHNLKKDYPSGTAIEIGKTISNSSNRIFQINNKYLPNNYKIRKKGEIRFSISRCGGVIGDHNVMFINLNERLELNHKVINRTTFAKGAVQAAIWLYKNKKEIPGLYSMQDII